MQFNCIISLLFVIPLVLGTPMKSGDSSSSLIRNRRIKRQFPCIGIQCAVVQFAMDIHCAHFKYLFALIQAVGRKKRSIGHDCSCCGSVRSCIYFFLLSIKFISKSNDKTISSIILSKITEIISEHINTLK